MREPDSPPERSADALPPQSPVSGPMVFALAPDGGLRAFPSAADAASSCRAVDGKGTAWLFFADDGSPLEARFEPQVRRSHSPPGSSTYLLQRAMSGLWLQERLAQVRKVEGGGLATIAHLVELLKINRGKRVANPRTGR